MINSFHSFPAMLTMLAAVSSLAVGLGSIVAWVTRRQAAALRHFIWLLVLMMPWVALIGVESGLRISIPILHQPAAALETSRAAQFDAAALKQDEGDQGSATLLSSGLEPDHSGKWSLPCSPWTLAWAIGLVLFGARLVAAHASLHRLVRFHAQPAPTRLRPILEEVRKHFGYARPVRLLMTPTTEIPFCCGILFPIVVLPESAGNWDGEKIEICVTHEMAHLVRGDLLSMALAQATCLLCWFNPLAWFAARRLRDEAEKAADDRVLLRKVRPETYASNLVALTEKYRAAALSPALSLSMARPNRLKARIESILDPRARREAPGLRTVLATSLLVFVSLVAGMSLRLVAAPNAPPLVSAPAAAAGVAQAPAPALAQSHATLDQALFTEARTPCVEFAGVGKTQAAQRTAIEQLLAEGADPNARDGRGTPALEYALEFGSDEVACALIEHGAEFRKPDAMGNENSAWTAACMFFCPKALDLMIKKGVKITGVDKKGGNILHHVSEASPLGPGHPSFFGGVPYSEERQKAYEDRVRRSIDLLVAAGADLNAQDNSAGVDGHRTPLMAALRASPHVTAALALIDHGANVTLTDAEGNTALAFLFTWGWGNSGPVFADLVEGMLNHGVDANSLVVPLGDKPADAVPVMEMALTSSANRSPADLAALRKMMAVFLEHGAVFPKANEAGQSLLKAAAAGDLKSMQDMVGQGAAVDSADGYGWTPLALTTALGYREASLWLLSRNAMGTAQVNRFWSPLALAAQGDQGDVVTALLAKGPYPPQQLNRALGAAVRNGDQPMFDALLKAGADAKTVYLFLCVQEGQVAMAKAALEAGLDPSKQRADIVYWAVNYHQPEILRMLLDHGADPVTPGNMGETPLALARKLHPDLVPMLQEAIEKSGHRINAPQHGG